MKHGKAPTRKQKMKIKKLGLNPENWLISKDNPNELVIVHRHTNTVRIKRFKEGN